MSLFGSSPNTQVVASLLEDLSKSLGDEHKDGSLVLLRKLDVDANPTFVMTLLAPNLFLGRCESLNLTHHESLDVLLFLATIEPGAYLKPASRAIKAFTTHTQSDLLQVSDRLLQVMIAQLSGNDVEVSSNAAEAVIACCRRLPMAERALDSLTDIWKSIWEHRESDQQNATIVCIRCASAIVELWCLPGTIKDSSSLDSLITMMAEHSDPLLQMSTLDLIETMASTVPVPTHRSRWLYDSRVLEPLLEMAGATTSPDPILGGQALRVLANIAKLSHQDAILFEQGGEHLLTSFHHILRNFDVSGGEVDRLAMIDAISSFASASSDALDIVLDDPIIRNRWLSLTVAQPQLKAAVLLSVVRVLDPPLENLNAPGDRHTDGAGLTNNTLAMKLYATLGSCNGNRDVTDLLLSLAKSPVTETRLASYAVFEAMAKRGVGAQVLLSHPEFYDFLITRLSVEITKEGRESKYAIVVAILKSDARNLLADKIVQELETYAKQGPHYVQTQRWDVTTGE